MESSEVKNKRIAKNTILLYIRTFFTMLISLYTSRLVLKYLGIDNFGVYNVVGGIIAMFSIVTNPISSAISRFLTYGIGKGDKDNLRTIFSMSTIILLGLGAIAFILVEIIGVWFLNNKLNIPPESMTAAHWVLQCSMISMILGLATIPYNAAIIAHEKMGIYAYMSIIEVVLKLTFVFCLVIVPWNKLIFYAVGILACSTIMRVIYNVYCRHNFEECRFKFVFDKKLFKSMTGFAWWTFFGNTAYILNTQGTSLLMNMYFGVVVNTAKGLAAQVEGAVISFIESFTTAFSPQITKSYAEGNKEYMESVMCRGSKFTLFLFLFFLIPLVYEAPMVLKLWLGEVPPYAATFLRLSLLCTATMKMGSPFLLGINATGNIKIYQITVTVIGCLVFPVTWLSYKFGLNVSVFYWIYIIIYSILIWVRMGFVRKLLGMKISLFTHRVFIPVILCGFLSAIPGWIIANIMADSLIRLIIMTIVSSVATAISVYYLGLSKTEKIFLINKIKTYLQKSRLSSE